MALFGDLEMKKFAESSQDPRIQAMWKRISQSKSNAAKWCKEAYHLREVNAELLEACKSTLTYLRSLRAWDNPCPRSELMLAEAIAKATGGSDEQAC